MNMIIGVANSSMLVLLMLTAGVSGDTPERSKEDSDMKNIGQTWELYFMPWTESRELVCGRLAYWNLKPRSILDASQKQTGDVLGVDTHVNVVPNPSRRVFQVPVLNTDVNDVSKLDKNTHDRPEIYQHVNDVSKLDKNTHDRPEIYQHVNDVSKLDKNTHDRPEIYQHVNDEQETDKIIGGFYAMRGEIPWQVNILVFWQQMCGGSIINEFFILTSAHCLYEYSDYDIIVVVGDYLQSRADPGEQLFLVDKVILHEEYVPSNGTAQFDIALIKILTRPNGKGIMFGDNVQPICLPIYDTTPSVGTPFIFSGWGYSNTNGTVQPDVLKRAVLPLMALRTCTLVIGILPPDTFCAGNIYGDNDVCSGDSGGPLVYRKQGYFVIYGIAQASSGCALPNLPVLFTNVSVYLSWIQDKLKQHSSNRIEETIPRRPHVNP